MRHRPSKKQQKPKNIKKKESIKKDNYPKDSSIIETTYEKVLSIINNVKDFIKKNSNNSNKLIQDLEWVIKVIANKSLYSYELKKPQLLRQNSDFNRFVNFVAKYNEEIIQMNPRHILVSGLLNIVKKGAILKKPSLCLKRILPEDLRNMDYEKEKDKRNRKKNLINLIGNAILNLYYKTIEKEKTEENDNIIKESEDKVKLNNSENVNKINDDEEGISKISTNDKNRNISKNNRNKKNNVIGIRKKNLVNNNTSYSVGKRKNNSIHKKNIKNANLTLNINNPMDNYSKYTLTEQQNINEAYPYKSNLIKNRNTIKINNNSRINNKLYNNTIENNKNTSFEIINCEHLIRQKLKKYKNNLSYSKNKGDIFNKADFNTNSKIKFQNINEPLEYTKNKNILNTDYKQKAINKMAQHKNISENDEEDIQAYITKVNISKKEVKISLNKLIDYHFNDMKNIIDKDFDIFDFKSKVGYRNVLPLMCHCIIKTLGLLDRRIISLPKLESFLYSVNDNYKESTLYHNSLHGADVTQSLCVFFINSNAEQICETSVLDLLGMIISAIGHDLGHPGLTNNYHINARTDLALTYNDASCLENFHCSFLFKIIQKDENNIFEKLSVDNYKNIRKRMISQILATDMANHGEVMSLIRTKIKLFQEQGEEKVSDNSFLLSGNEKTKFDEQQVLLNYLIHMADLGHNCKKYEISKKWVKLLCEEFWIQGDKEKHLGIPISFLCDRDKIDVPTSQVNFLKGFIISSFDSLVEMFPKLGYTMDNAKNNINNWQKLLDQRRITGWTPKREDFDEKEDNDEKEE